MTESEPLPFREEPCAHCPHDLALHSAQFGCLVCGCTHDAGAADRLPKRPGLPGSERVLLEAELAMRGLRAVTVAHGAPETPDEAWAVFETLPALAAESGTVAARTGGAEHTTYLFSGPDAEEAAVAFMIGVHTIAESWWEITPAAYPR